MRFLSVHKFSLLSLLIRSNAGLLSMRRLCVYFYSLWILLAYRGQRHTSPMFGWRILPKLNPVHKFERKLNPFLFCLADSVSIINNTKKKWNFTTLLGGARHVLWFPIPERINIAYDTGAVQCSSTVNIDVFIYYTFLFNKAGVFLFVRLNPTNGMGFGALTHGHVIRAANSGDICRGGFILNSKIQYRRWCMWLGRILSLYNIGRRMYRVAQTHGGLYYDFIY